MKSKQKYAVGTHQSMKRQLPNKYQHNRPRVYQPSGRVTPLFQGNLAQNMNFGGKGHELSGYVRREIVTKDLQGNIQRARETQFFNSGRKLGRVRINDDETEW